MKSQLHFSRSGAGPDVVVLHGLFGMGSNLGSLARALAGHFRVHSLDLPNHGRSAWVSSMTLAQMAAAVTDYMDSAGISSAGLVGHSLGGKVAMQLALSEAPRVTSLVVADIAPVTYPPRHLEIFAALNVVAAARCKSRGEVASLLARQLPEEGVRQFLLLSLQRDGEGVYRWRFNLEVIEREYASLRAGIDLGPQYNGAVLFVQGGKSDYILPQYREHTLGLFPAAELKLLPDCGHWLHAEQPLLFNRIVSRFLLRSLVA